MKEFHPPRDYCEEGDFGIELSELFIDLRQGRLNPWRKLAVDWSIEWQTAGERQKHYEALRDELHVWIANDFADKGKAACVGW